MDDETTEPKNDADIEKATARVHCENCDVDATFDYPASTPPGTKIKWEHGQDNDDDSLCDIHERDADGAIVEDENGFGVPAEPFVGIFTVPDAA